MTIHYECCNDVAVVTIDCPDKRNAVDAATAHALHAAFERFEGDPGASVAVLTGAGNTFCAGADLAAIAAGEDTVSRILTGDIGPMGPTRMTLSKPVIAAVEGHAVAGGLELACWCDLRVAARSALFGVFCRRFGVPLVDLGTIRLPRLIGHSQAMDMILTGRGVGAPEALRIGLVNRLVDDGAALEHAVELAEELARHPQACLRGDRLSAIEQWSLGENEAMQNEIRRARETLESGETVTGATGFARGRGRHGDSLADNDESN
ncbi:MAG: crotonase/enoyl-CoA hydratase family protein [Wenzhouxiangellaceae bacterium]|nr:crotonase/enoyl-CoA hydratase family protein [Wenzhouxiangellaceae bacterium]